MTDTAPTPLATLRRARRIAHAEGLRHVYTGNVVDPEGASTTCARCGETLIERDGFAVRAYRLVDARCSRCGATLAGVFDAPPDGTGGRRVRLRFGG